MIFFFTEEEEKYLIAPPRGPYICSESKTPAEILKKLKLINKEYNDMVGCDIIVFEK
jgi:hypothetical protein